MCIGSDLSTLCALGHKLMHGIIRDTSHCPDPVKMGAVSPQKMCTYALPKWAGFTARPVIPHLQSRSSAGLWAVAGAQRVLG